MFKYVKKDKRPELVKEIDRLCEQMRGMDPTTEDYFKLCQRVEILQRSESSKKTNFFSKDAVLNIGTNFVIVIVVLLFEERNVITTKFNQFILKGRV